MGFWFGQDALDSAVRCLFRVSDLMENFPSGAGYFICMDIDVQGTSLIADLRQRALSYVLLDPGRMSRDY